VDLFAILTSLRRHWLITLVVCLATGAALFGSWKLLPRDYEARASYVLVNPVPDPTPAQLAVDPSLAQVNRNNPYLRFSNQATVGQVLAGRVSGGAVRQDLEARGADSGYVIAPSADFGGGTGRVMDLTGTGTSAAQAELTLDLVTQRM
jgi:hypothetical protein